MIIYKVTNLVNGKIYVGLTKQSLAVRWYQHNWDSQNKKQRKFHNAINKYGSQNFKIDVIEECSDLATLSEREKYWISFYDSCKTGYNVLTGGIGIQSDSWDAYWDSLSSIDRERVGQEKARLRQGQSTKKNKTSPYVGVRKNQKSGTFQTVIVHNKRRYLKNFPTELEAAAFYDKLALYFYGQNAKTNFDPSNYSPEDLEKAVTFLNSRYVKPGRRYYGIYFSKRNGWIATWSIKSKRIFSISAKSEEDAYKLQQERLKLLGITSQ